MTHGEKKKSLSYYWLSAHREQAKSKYELLFNQRWLGNHSLEQLAVFLDKPQNHWVLDNMKETNPYLGEWTMREIKKWNPLTDFAANNAFNQYGELAFVHRNIATTGSEYIFITPRNMYKPNGVPPYGIRFANHRSERWKNADGVNYLNIDITQDVAENKTKISQFLNKVKQVASNKELTEMISKLENLVCSTIVLK